MDRQAVIARQDRELAATPPFVVSHERGTINRGHEIRTVGHAAGIAPVLAASHFRPLQWLQNV
jgi:hypothetical protein